MYAYTILLLAAPTPKARSWKLIDRCRSRAQFALNSVADVFIAVKAVCFRASSRWPSPARTAAGSCLTTARMIFWPICDHVSRPWVIPAALAVETSYAPPAILQLLLCLASHHIGGLAGIAAARQGRCRWIAFANGNARLRGRQEASYEGAPRRRSPVQNR
jgi:hypothetical protein